MHCVRKHVQATLKKPHCEKLAACFPEVAHVEFLKTELIEKKYNWL